MIIGFTGTRRGMRPAQQVRVFSILHNLKDVVDEARHGDCLGADEQFHEMCQILGFRIIIHPPSDDRFRAFCQMAHQVKQPNDYLTRDRHIVRSSTLMIAAPRTTQPERRSGTWYTARYALKHKRDLIKVFPDGEVVPVRAREVSLYDFWDRLSEDIINA